MERQRIAIPKGTLIKINGIPCELAEDTVVFSVSLESDIFKAKTFLENQRKRESWDIDDPFSQDFQQ